jgi:hypothetical protein
MKRNNSILANASPRQARLPVSKNNKQMQYVSKKITDCF